MLLPGWLLRCLASYQNPGALTISFATAKHLVEAGVLALTPAADGSVGIAAMLGLTPDLGWISREHLLSLALFVTCALATWAMHSHKIDHLVSAALLVPQQAFLVMTCIGALIAVVGSHYADGVPRPSAFILCDQIVRILLAPVYTIAIFARARWYDHGRFGAIG